MTSSVNKISGTRKAGLLSFAGIVFYCAHILQQAQARDEAAIIANSDMALDTSNDNVVAEQVSPESIDQLNANPISEASVMSADLSTVNVNEEDDPDAPKDQASKTEPTDDMSGAAKVGLATVAVGGITALAVGSSDGSNDTSVDAVSALGGNTEADRIKAEAEKAAKEKAEEEAKAKEKEAADKLKAEEEAKAKEKVEAVKEETVEEAIEEAEEEAIEEAEEEVKVEAVEEAAPQEEIGGSAGEEQPAAEIADGLLKRVDILTRDNPVIWNPHTKGNNDDVLLPDDRMVQIWKAEQPGTDKVTEILKAIGQNESMHSAAEGPIRGSDFVSVLKATPGHVISEIAMTDGAFRVIDHLTDHKYVNFYLYKSTNGESSDALYRLENFDGHDTSMVLMGVLESGDHELHPLSVPENLGSVMKFSDILIERDGGLEIRGTEQLLTSEEGASSGTGASANTSIHLALSAAMEGDRLQLAIDSDFTNAKSKILKLAQAKIDIFGKEEEINLVSSEIKPETTAGAGDEITVVRQLTNDDDFFFSVTQAKNNVGTITNDATMSVSLSAGDAGNYEEFDASMSNAFILNPDNVPSTLSADIQALGKIKIAQDVWVNFGDASEAPGGFFVDVYDATYSTTGTGGTFAATMTIDGTKHDRKYVKWEGLESDSFSTKANIAELPGIAMRFGDNVWDYVSDDQGNMTVAVERDGLLQLHEYRAVNEMFSPESGVRQFIFDDVRTDSGEYGPLSEFEPIGGDKFYVSYYAAATVDGNNEVTSPGTFSSMIIEKSQIQAKEAIMSKLTAVSGELGDFMEARWEVDQTGVTMLFDKKLVKLAFIENSKGDFAVDRQDFDLPINLANIDWLGDGSIVTRGNNGDIARHRIDAGELKSEIFSVTSAMKQQISDADALHILEEKSGGVMAMIINTDDFGNKIGTIIKSDAVSGAIHELQSDINLNKVNGIQSHRDDAGHRVTLILEDKVKAAVGSQGDFGYEAPVGHIYSAVKFNSDEYESGKVLDVWEQKDLAGVATLDVGDIDTMVTGVKKGVVLAYDADDSDGKVYSLMKVGDTITKVHEKGIAGDVDSGTATIVELKAVMDLNGKNEAGKRLDLLLENSDGDTIAAFRNSELRDQVADPDLYDLLKLDSPIAGSNPLDIGPITIGGEEHGMLTVLNALGNTGVIIESFEGANRGMDSLLHYADDQGTNTLTFGDILQAYSANDPLADFAYFDNLGIQNSLSELSTAIQALVTASQGSETAASIIEDAYKASGYPMADLANLGVDFDPADIYVL